MGESDLVQQKIDRAIQDGESTLDLSEMGIESLPLAICKLVTVRELDLSRNRLTKLPDGISNLASLQLLDLHKNQLKRLPESIGSLSTLQSMLIYDNHLDCLPEISGLTSLERLDLDKNRLRDLPSGIGMLGNLRILSAADNCLSSLPPSIGGLKNLSFLNLVNNALEELPESMYRLLALQSLYLHGNDLLNIPRNLLGSAPYQVFPAELGRCRPADVLDGFFNKLAPEADQLEQEARGQLLNQEPDYERVCELFVQIVQLDRGRAHRLKKEFGFLFDFELLPDSVRLAPLTITTRLEWRRRVWKLLSNDNNIRIRSQSEYEYKVHDPAPQVVDDPGGDFHVDEDSTVHPVDYEHPVENDRSHDLKNDKSVQPGITPASTVINEVARRPEEKGEQLEQAVLELFRTFFLIDSDDSRLLLTKLRQQKRGTQFGRDIDISFQSVLPWNHQVHCHVECKHIKGSVKLSHVTEKVATYDADQSDIHHWILISPFASPSNDLNRILDVWQLQRRHSFTVQVWSPDNKVEEFFGLDPAVFNSIYSASDQKENPRFWTKERRESVFERWREKLAPPLRLSSSLDKYLRNPLYLCLSHENHGMLNRLFGSFAEMYAKSEAGVPLNDQSLEQYVRDWMNIPEPEVLFVLGEFGDGKSSFTYILSRKLCDEFIQNSDDGWVPFRFALRDYFNAGSSREFLERRLGEIGVAIGEWNHLRHSKRVLVVLDGFDEISRQLDPATVTANIRALKNCLDEFVGCKVIVTSRTHFFESRRDKQRLLRWLGSPLVYQLAPLTRYAVNAQLRLSVGAAGEQILHALGDMHDPIGLAAKPMYLQMLKDTLDELPEDLDEIALYDAYIARTLSRKVEYLEQNQGYLDLPNELGDKLKLILEDIALALQQSSLEHVSLSQWAEDEGRQWAHLLWEMSQGHGDGDRQRVEDDAMARVGVRSLLTRVDTPEMEQKWTVDFCHRSVREFFVARRLVRALGEDVSLARSLFGELQLGHEILNFVAALLRRSVKVDGKKALLGLLHTAKIGDAPINLGRNALTTLFRMTGELEGTEWKSLLLDGVDLAGADLTGKHFVGSSLRDANLDNVNFEEADFTNCDLTGVRIEETAAVGSVVALGEDQFLASYADGVVRHWDISNARRASDRVVFIGSPHSPILLGTQPTGDVWAHQSNEVIFFDWNSERCLIPVGRFEVRRDCVGLRFDEDGLTTLLEDGDRSSRPVAVDLDRNVVSLMGASSAATVCAKLGRLGFVLNVGGRGLEIVSDTRKEPHENGMILQAQMVTSLTAISIRDGVFMIACGQQNGVLKIWEVTREREGWAAKEVCQSVAHDNHVRSIEFLSPHRVVTGGVDRSVVIFEFDTNYSVRSITRLERTLRCKGMKFDGVKGLHEYELLANIVGKVESS